MNKIKIGDVFKIKTPKGFVFLHYVYNNGKSGELIRVLPGFYENIESEKDIENIATQKELFLIFFPLYFAYRKKIVLYAGHSVIKDFLKPKFMRIKDKIGDKSTWYIVNTETFKREAIDKLTNEHKKLSPWGIWNDTILIERLINGWNLDNWE